MRTEIRTLEAQIGKKIRTLKLDKMLLVLIKRVYIETNLPTICFYLKLNNLKK